MTDTGLIAVLIKVFISVYTLQGRGVPLRILLFVVLNEAGKGVQPRGPSLQPHHV
jgi:hypothetical protein